ncbi:branched-chain amino acid aminotransferase [Micromonospora sp. DT53]|uniref:branched-chain amino acid aminotransferase n=1 Tax=Micromonospora sp. DT53 TaxID=3393444 RepID=UPI003CF99B4D
MATFTVVPSDSPLPEAERKALMAEPGFGRVFTDHMATAVWTPEAGWSDHRIGKLQNFSLHPSAAVLHYAQEIFEGLKVYRHADGSLWLFRPEANAARFARSAERLALPLLDEETFLTSVTELVRQDEPWVPAYGGEESLYLRPFMFASEGFLGVRPAAEITYCVIACPVAGLFQGGVSGVRLWVSTNYTRAAPGGTGAAKCGGNYASSLAAQLEARDHGCDQVMYVDGVEHEWLEESGTMNMFMVTADHELVTPGLGTILEGITRDSILRLADRHGLTPVERRVSLTELRQRCADGTVTEVFAAGTAAVITPIIGFNGDGFEVKVADGEPGKTTMALREHLLDIQHGRAQDPFGWMRRVL